MVRSVLQLWFLNLKIFPFFALYDWYPPYFSHFLSLLCGNEKSKHSIGIKSVKIITGLAEAPFV